MVCPVSMLYWVLNVGSSSARLLSESPILSWSALVLGSIATEITGSGNLIVSKIIGFPISQIVSPVKVFFSPIAAMISPQAISSTSSRRLACIFNSLPTLSLTFRVEL